MSATQMIGDLQLAILRVLWTRAEATAAEVHAALQQDRGLAPTTISTMLAKMEGRGLVEHRAEGRRFVYRALVTEDQVTRSVVGEIKERLFRGDAAALVSHLLNEHEVSADELRRLKALIAVQEKKEA